jgi:hypothetical protein
MGRGHLSFFFNTDDTDGTENHPAHFDKASAASRQLMTRNLPTYSLVIYTLRTPIARAIPLPHRGGLGRGSTAPASPAPWGGLGRSPSFF